MFILRAWTHDVWLSVLLETEIELKISAHLLIVRSLINLDLNFIILYFNYSLL